MKRSIKLLCAVSILNAYICFAQTPDNSDFFVNSGIKYYGAGKTDDAMIEFENALILNKHNFEAKIWLAQIYLERKDRINARKLLEEAALAAPDHPKINRLLKLMGRSEKDEDENNSEILSNDPVMYETITTIGSDTALRPFGLVIPPNNITPNNTEISLMALDMERPQDTVNHSGKLNLDDYFGTESKYKGPLAEVFRLKDTNGIEAALDLYFEMVAKDPSVASIDDKGLLTDAMEVFKQRYKEVPGKQSNIYYHGMLLFINSVYSEANQVLSPLRKNGGIYTKRLKPVFAILDKWIEGENERIRLAKKEEAEKRELERLIAEQQSRKKRASWTNKVNTKTKDIGGKAATASASDKAVAEALHTQGYDLYKKGKLDEAIEKYNESLKKDGRSSICLYHLGLAWTDKGLAGDTAAFDKAVGYFQEVISIDPNSKNAADSRSMIRDINMAKGSMGQ